MTIESAVNARAPASWFWRDIVVPFALSRFGLAVAGVLAERFGTMRSIEWHASSSMLIDIWARWDSYHYWTIAADGYAYVPGTMSNVAFFPLYPMLLRLLTLGSRDSASLMVAGWLVSNVSTVAALALLHKLISLDFPPDVVRRTISFTIWFPTSFYLSVVYTEGMFLLLTVAAFYCARRQRWVAAGILGGLSAATRLIGALLILPLLCEWYRLTPRRRSSAWPLLLVPCGLLAYMAYLRRAFGDPLLFLYAHSAWGRSTSAQSFGERFQYIVNFFLSLPVAEIVGRIGVDLAFTLVCGLLLLGLWRQRPSYAVYCLYSLGAPLATLQVLSMPRFVVVIFPLFIVAAEWMRHRVLFKVTLLVFGVLQAVFFARWVLWYWLA